MSQTNMLLNKILYLIPRMVLFAIIMFSLAITLIISVDSLAILRPSLNALRQSIFNLFGM